MRAQTVFPNSPFVSRCADLCVWYTSYTAHLSSADKIDAWISRTDTQNEFQFRFSSEVILTGSSANNLINLAELNGHDTVL